VPWPEDGSVTRANARDLVVRAGPVAAVCVLVLAVALWAGTGPYLAIGVTNPGAVVRLATPVMRLVVDLAASLCAGALTFACWFAPRGPDGEVMSAEAYWAVRFAARWASVWCVASMAMVTLSATAGAGLPLAAVATVPRWAGLVAAQEQPCAWLVAVVLSGLVAVGCRTVLGWRPLAGLLLLAVAAVLMPLAAGHSSSDTNHDIATEAIAVHVPVAAVWLGVLICLLHRAAAGADTSSTAARYRRFAAGCWFVVAGSGLVDAAVLAPGSWGPNSTYVVILAFKVAIMVAVGVFGMWGRKRALSRLNRPGGGGLRRLLGLELVLLLTATGLAAALTRLFPPAFARPVTIPQTLLGYALAGPPTLARLAADWRPEVLLGSLGVGLAVLYLTWVARLRRAGQRWPPARTAVWLSGCMVIVVATCSGIGRYEPAMFSVHMLSHMLLGFVAPGLLAQGAPISLALAAAGPRRPGDLPVGATWLSAVASSPLARLATHPVVALTVFAGSPFVFYLSAAFDASARFHWARMIVDCYFLVVGYLFWWPTIGSDPSPRPLPNLARLGMLLAAGPFTALFAAAVVTTRRVLGDGAAGYNMYSALHLPWVSSLLAEQRVGGVVALTVGEISLFVAMAVLLRRWGRVDDDPEATGLATTADLVEMSKSQAVGHHQQ
jgi:putative copper resistance protein D